LIDLSVVIPSFETRALLLACLESVEAAQAACPDLNLEIIVIDNGSRDGSADAIRLGHPTARLIALVRNRGFGAAVNIGLGIKRGRHVLLLNSDVEVESDLLIEGVRILDEDPKAGVVGPHLIHPDGRPQRSVHALPGLQTEFLPEFVLRWLRPDGFSEHRSGESAGRGSAVRRVEAVRGAAFFVRGVLVEALGPFDENFFFFLEETEYCARVRAAGFDVVFAESLAAVHHLGASSKNRAPLTTRIEFHRSLYHFLAEYRGRAVAVVSRTLRTLRGGLLILAMTVVFPFSAKTRSRISERWGLLLWHLRGCPGEPGLADVFAGIEDE